MTHTVRLVVVPLAFLLLGSAAIAAGPVASRIEEKLVGAWQEGMTSRLAGGNAGQLHRATAAGLLGAVVQYNGDHTFVMYPPCGRKKDDLRKAGFESMKGNWELTEAGDLISKLDFGGRSMKIETKVTWKDDQLVLLNRDGSVASKSGRYSGPLPPSC